MELISKEAVSELFKKFYEDEHMRVDELETLLVAACKELDPWIPIDEHTPKDRRLLLYDKFVGRIIGLWHEGHWVSSMVIMHYVTHYKELPPDPKD